MADKLEKFNGLVRVGYFSRAVFYIVLGVIALQSVEQVREGNDGIFALSKICPVAALSCGSWRSVWALTPCSDLPHR